VKTGEDQRVVHGVEGARQSRPGPSFELVESKLHPPSARPGIVPRTVLVEQLLASQTSPIIGVVAPAGYGKTTLLAQWAARTRGRVAWVSVDRPDNDPVVLLTYLAVALDRVEPIDPTVFQALASPGVSIVATVVPRFASAISALTEPVAVVLDHVELLDNQECLDAVAELAERLGADQLGRTPAESRPLSEQDRAASCSRCWCIVGDCRCREPCSRRSNPRH
jgi:LuxR family transcriptional regulator, maltose regulon positive regulatory protein